MGFDLMLIATDANGMKIPPDVKCCFCGQLLDDGVCLSGCHHNSCYKCMKNRSPNQAKCPHDGLPYDPKRYQPIGKDVEDWLKNIKLKCKWFDGRFCVATAISIRNSHRHEELCPNNPKNKLRKELTDEQKEAVKLVAKWMNNKETAANDGKSEAAKRECFAEWTPRKGLSSRTSVRNSKPKPKSHYARRSRYQFHSEKSNPEADLDWRK